MPKPRPKAILYARISQDREGKQLGVNRQLRECRTLASKLGLDVIEELTDNDTSLYRLKARPGWDCAKRLIAEGTASRIVAWHVDRIYRHPIELEELIVLVEDQDVRIHTVTTGENAIDPNTEGGRLAARIAVNVARHEVELKSRRQVSQRLEMAQAGLWNGGPRPLGYNVDRAHKTLTINKREAAVLAEAARRIVAGDSLAASSRWVEKKLGRQIPPRVLKGALTSPTIAGLRLHIPQKARQKWIDRRAKDEVTGDLPPTVKTYPGTWQAILSLSEWHEVRAILLDPSRRSAEHRPRDSLLRGVLRCDVCGKGLGYSRTSYKCMKSVGGCGTVSVSTRPVEALVQSWAEAAIFDAGITAEIPDEVDKSALLDAERGSLEDRRKRIHAMFADGRISDEDYEATLGEINARTDSLNVAFVGAERARAAQRELVRAEATWNDADAQARNRILRAMFDHVRVMPSAAGRKSGPRFDESRVAPVWRA